MNILYFIMTLFYIFKFRFTNPIHTIYRLHITLYKFKYQNVEFKFKKFLRICCFFQKFVLPL